MIIAVETYDLMKGVEFMEDRDAVIRKQMDEISRLINNNLELITKDLFGSKRPEPKKEGCKIIPFPEKR